MDFPIGTEGLKLHVGCGPNAVDGWENLDKSPSVFFARWPKLRSALRHAGVFTEPQAVGFPTGIIHGDVSKGLPYAASSVQFIYSSHLIEHMSRWQALAFVRECERVLMPRGVMRIATPDLATLVRAYVSRVPGQVGDAKTPADVLMTEINAFHELPGTAAQRLIRRMFSGSIHQWLYDAESLRSLLTEGGLPDAEICCYRVGRIPDLDRLEIRPASLFMEVRRK